MTKAKNIREAENIVNIELQKISTWATNNKIKFNEHKSNKKEKERQKGN
jgi:hypothetical protein